MSIKTNTIANYIGRIYVIVTGIVVLPLYMKYLGDEAYGLVGLFTIVQSWLQLLNMGLAPTLGREAARARVSESGFSGFYRILVSYELIFLSLVSLMVFTVLFASDWFSSVWLNVENLPVEDVDLAVILMLFAAAVRFQGGLYRSGIMGLEHQVFVNVLDVIFVSLRFLGGLFLVAVISNDVVHYFVYQLSLSILEILIFRTKQFSIVPLKSKSSYWFYWGDVKPTLPFAMGIAYTAGVWVLITQVDKALLSGVLTLKEFGYYSLVALVVGGILQISHPLSEAIRPRLTALAESGCAQELHALYLLGSQIVSAICCSAAFVIAFNAKVLIFLWTGNEDAAVWSEDVLFWFSLGNGILAVATFQYYLQFAYGKLKLHVFGSTLAACVQIPIIAYAAFNYGALGAAKAWFGVRLFFFLFWVPVVHRAFAKGLHMQWLVRAIAPVFGVALSVTALWPVTQNPFEYGRLELLLDIGLQSMVVLLATILCIRQARGFVWVKIQHAIK